MYKTTGAGRPSFATEVEAAVRDRAIAYQIKGSKIIAYVNEGAIQVERSRGITALTKAVAQTKSMLFRTHHSARGEITCMKMQPLGKQILQALDLLPPILAQYPCHSFSPHFDLFMRHAQRMGLVNMPGLEYTAGPATAQWVAILNEFVANIRRDGMASRFKDRVKNFSRGPNENYVQIMAYAEAHSNLSQSLCIGRMDFGYRAGKEQGPTMLVAELPSYDQLVEDRRQLVALASKALGSALLGYIWKLEFASDKGFQYHMVFIFSDLPESVFRGVMPALGNLWNNDVTRGAGFHYDCAAFGEGYKASGVGRFEPSNQPEQWDEIRKMAIYLTEPDNNVRLALPGGARAFGKGNMPTPTKKLPSTRRKKGVALLEKQPSHQAASSAPSAPSDPYDNLVIEAKDWNSRFWPGRESSRCI